MARDRCGGSGSGRVPSGKNIGILANQKHDRVLPIHGQVLHKMVILQSVTRSRKKEVFVTFIFTCNTASLFFMTVLHCV